jgi:protein involved in polysaccharide export with SLBB domain
MEGSIGRARFFGTFRRLSALVLLGVFVSQSFSVLPAQSQPPVPGPAAGQEPPRPGDLIRIRIWREPELSGDFPVEETGLVVLPRIGAVDVTTETPASLRQKLTDTYAEFLQHSSISVTLLRRIQILGAVRNPGLYPVDPTMTVADALALAGGTTLHGKAQMVEIVRQGQRITSKLSAETPIANSPLRSGDQIYVPERNWISRNAGVVSAALTATVSLAIALLRR